MKENDSWLSLFDYGVKSQGKGMRAPPCESLDVSNTNHCEELTTVSEIIKTTSAKRYKKIIWQL